MTSSQLPPRDPVKLEHPWHRDTLIDYLRELSDRETQERDWLPGQGNFDYVVHFLFDDQEPHDALGYYLRTQAEVNAVVAVYDAIDSVLNLYGTELEDLEYVAKPEWSNVIATSRRALEILARS